MLPLLFLSLTLALLFQFLVTIDPCMVISVPVAINPCIVIWFKHILFMTEHDKGLGRAKKLRLALSKTHTHAHIICLH